MTTGIVQEKRINIMDICKINTQIERLEEVAERVCEILNNKEYEL
jgi:tetrahydromethanopterin S-methyltransferase subunit B